MLKDISKLKPGTDVIAKIQHDLTLLELNNTQLLEIVSQKTQLKLLELLFTLVLFIFSLKDQLLVCITKLNILFMGVTQLLV